MKSLYEYYENLYTLNDDIKYSLDEFIGDLNVNRLNEVDKENCEGIMTVDECTKVLKKMKNDTSTGIDGLTPGFYKVFWTKKKHLIVNSMNLGLQTGQLSRSQKKGIIVLII